MLVLKTGAKNSKWPIRLIAKIILASIENSAILNGVLVSPLEKNIGVNILCKTNAGKPVA